jgi:hypothetical protein
MYSSDETEQEILVRILATKDHRLIADQTGSSIHDMRIAPLGLEIRHGSRDKEAASLVRVVQPIEIQSAASHRVVSARLAQQQVEHVDIVHLAVGDVNKAESIAAQRRVDSRFGRPE